METSEVKIQYPTLNEVIEKIKTISGIKDDDIINIDEVFNSLSKEEKLVLVKGMINITKIIEKTHLYLFNKDDKDLLLEMQDIELFNKQELIKLRNWFSKMLFLVLMPIFLSVLTFVYFLDTNVETSFKSGLDDIMKLIKVIFL